MHAILSLYMPCARSPWLSHADWDALRKPLAFELKASLWRSDVRPAEHTTSVGRSQLSSEVQSQLQAGPTLPKCLLQAAMHLNSNSSTLRSSALPMPCQPGPASAHVHSGSHNMAPESQDACDRLAGWPHRSGTPDVRDVPVRPARAMPRTSVPGWPVSTSKAPSPVQSHGTRHLLQHCSRAFLPAAAGRRPAGGTLMGRRRSAAPFLRPADRYGTTSSLCWAVVLRCAMRDPQQADGGTPIGCGTADELCFTSTRCSGSDQPERVCRATVQQSAGQGLCLYGMSWHLH